MTQDGTIKRVSLGPDFAEANGPSSAPALSGDGRFVAFASAADNLVAGRHQRRPRRVRLRPPAEHGDPGQRGRRRHPGRRGQPLPVDRRHRRDRGLHLGGHQPGGRRRQRVRPTSSSARLGTEPVARRWSAWPAGGSGRRATAPATSRASTATAPRWRSRPTPPTSWPATPTARPTSSGGTWPPAATELVSLRDGSSTTPGNGDSFSPSMSGDGSTIAFASDATNLDRPVRRQRRHRRLPPRPQQRRRQRPRSSAELRQRRRRRPELRPPDHQRHRRRQAPG